MNKGMTVKDLFELLRCYSLDMPVRLKVYGHCAQARAVNLQDLQGAQPLP